jgi:hypothetical protein
VFGQLVEESLADIECDDPSAGRARELDSLRAGAASDVEDSRTRWQAADQA